MAEVMLFGEPMVLFVADREGPLEDAESFSRMLAGAEINVAIGLTRLGHPAAYYTKLGKDPFGRYIEKKLKSEKIGALVSYDDRHNTGFMLKGRVEKGDPETAYYRKDSAASHMTEEDVAGLDLSGIRILHLTGIPPALSPSCRSASFRLIREAKKRGILVSFDPNLRPSLWESREEMVRTVNALAAESDVVMPGAGEGEILAGTGDPEKIAAFYRNMGVDTVIVKNGANGAFLDSREGKKHCPGFQVSRVVDTVGAGDGFAVGILSGILEQLPMEETVRRGNAIGAIQVSVRSDNEALPTREELQAFLEKGN